MPSPSANPTPITPPRVPLIDPRTGLIDRAWYLFFLSLNRIAAATIDATDSTGPDSASLIAAYDLALQSVNQNLQTLPSDLVAEIAEMQKQIDALALLPPVLPPEPDAPIWIDLVSRPSTLVGTSTVSGVSGDVRLHVKVGKTDVYRFIPSPYDPLLDAFYTTFVASVLSGLIVVRA